MTTKKGTFSFLSGQVILENINLDTAFNNIIKSLNHDNNSFKNYIKVVKDNKCVNWYDLINYDDNSFFTIVIYIRDDTEIEYFYSNIMAFDSSEIELIINILNYFQINIKEPLDYNELNIDIDKLQKIWANLEINNIYKIKDNINITEIHLLQTVDYFIFNCEYSYNYQCYGKYYLPNFIANNKVISKIMFDFIGFFTCDINSDIHYYSDANDYYDRYNY
jgi:hypothetical protein